MNIKSHNDINFKYKKHLILEVGRETEILIMLVRVFVKNASVLGIERWSKNEVEYLTKNIYNFINKVFQPEVYK